MAIVFPTTDLIGTGTQIGDSASDALAFGNGDTLIISEGINIVSTNDHAIEMTANGNNNATVLVAGLVASGSISDGLSLDLDEALDYQITVNTTDTGVVYGGAFAYYLGSNSNQLLAGDSIYLNNSGFASGEGGTLVFLAENGTVENSGTMVATEDDDSFNSALRFFQVENASFTNSGVVSNVAGTGQTLFDFSFSNFSSIATVGYTSTPTAGEFRLTNSGEINSQLLAVFSDAQDYEKIVNTGSITGIVYLSGVSTVTSLLINSGLIDGDVVTNAGDDRVTNSDVITGDLSLGDDDDVYRALGDGVVLGTIDGGFGEDVIIGGSQTDNIYGDSGADIMNGLGGDDVLYGGFADDTMRGGEGDDLLYGGEDNDLAYGNDGDDILDGGIGNDTLNAGAGNDDVFGGDGEDVMFAGFGSDRLYGGKDNDILNGFIGGADSFADTLVGADGDDRIFAGNGADTLNAGNGNDTLSGGAGDDRIIGGFGGDLMTGGSGEDDFVFLSTGHSTLANGDVITDFTSGEDTLIVLALNLDTFIGTAAFSGSGDGEIRYGVVGSDVAVIIDADGNGTADMRFYLNDINSVAADDFLI